MVRVTAVLARIPVIKFRKGGFTHAAEGTHAPPPASGSPAVNVSAGPSGARITTSIHDYELPKRYQRRPISEEEIAAINSGGLL